MSLLGYSAKEISDVINGRITVTALDTALKMRSRGHSEKEISNYLDSTYKKTIARQRDSIMPEKRSQGIVFNDGCRADQFRCTCREVF